MSSARSINFCSLPVEVLGISVKRTSFGHLNPARCSRVNAITSAALAGGIKQTGYGREGGSGAIKDYLNVKYTHMGLKI